MDYVKIKTSHVLYNELTDAEVGQLVRFQAIVAFKEMPISDFDKKSIFSKQKLEKIETFLEKNGKVSLNKVQEKVLEDVQDVLKARRFWKEKKRSKRDSLRLEEKNVQVDISGEVHKGVYGDVRGQLSLAKLSLAKHKEAAALEVQNTAAAFSGDLKPKQDPVISEANARTAINKILDRGLRKFKDREAFFATMLESWKRNPGELEKWLQELHSYDEKMRAKKESEDAITLEHDEQAEAERLRLKELEAFKSLPESDRYNITKEATEVARKQMPPAMQNRPPLTAAVDAEMLSLAKQRFPEKFRQILVKNSQ